MATRPPVGAETHDLCSVWLRAEIGWRPGGKGQGRRDEELEGSGAASGVVGVERVSVGGIKHKVWLAFETKR